MDKHTLHIEPPKGLSTGFGELWRFRELLYFFTWRDIRVKYKQTFLGVTWALLQPLGMMLIFTFIFSRTLNIPSGNVPYPVFVLAGLVLWGLFSSGVSHASESMIQHANIIRKIYFPRLVIPCSAILTALFDFVMAFIIFIVICLYYKQSISMEALMFFPAGILITVVAAFGAGTFLSALNVKYRDFRYVVPFLLQLVFFSAQVIYPLSAITSPLLRNILSINPLNAAIELFRSALTGYSPDTNVVLIGTVVTLIIAMTGLLYFRKTESYFADIA